METSAAAVPPPHVLSRARHDLLTPLNAVVGYAGLLAEEAPERGRPHLVEPLSALKAAGRALLPALREEMRGGGCAQALAAGLRERCAARAERLAAEAAALVEAEDGGPDDELAADLRRLADAAARLRAMTADATGLLSPGALDGAAP